MSKINQLLLEYGESHQNETNKLIHWVCVPIIFFSVIGLLYCIKLPFSMLDVELNVGKIAITAAIVYYFTLSKSLSVGMLLIGILCLIICKLIGSNLLIVSIILFILAWIVQFYGHKIEGKKPSFFKDLQFLMIGPAWLMSFLYKKLGIKL